MLKSFILSCSSTAISSNLSTSVALLFTNDSSCLIFESSITGAFCAVTGGITNTSPPCIVFMSACVNLRSIPFSSICMCITIPYVLCAILLPMSLSALTVYVTMFGVNTNESSFLGGVVKYNKSPL